MSPSTDSLRYRARAPIILGRLVADRDGGLVVSVYCRGGCRTSHEIPWPADAWLDHIEYIPAPCQDLASPYRQGWLAVGLDPQNTTRNKALLAARKARLADDSDHPAARRGVANHLRDRLGASTRS